MFAHRFPDQRTGVMLKKIRPESGARRTIIDYGLTALVAVALAILVQTFVVKPYLIPSTSMANTLVPGQRVLVDRMVYHYRSVHRGDIIVFRRPEPPNDVLIKRVVGLPGDLLSVRGGHLFVNGVAPERVVRRQGRRRHRADRPRRPLRERSARRAVVARASRSACRPGHYFVMGDNRTDSSDSRYWGTVPGTRSSDGPSSPTGRSAASATSSPAPRLEPCARRPLTTR